MRTSIATVCLSGGLSEKLQAIAAAGFRGVEIFENDLLSYHGMPADVAKEIADLGLTLISSSRFATSRACRMRSGGAPSTARSESSI
jgi:4-hydroxyphenylpyruvate dioxygenase